MSLQIINYTLYSLSINTTEVLETIAPPITHIASVAAKTLFNSPYTMVGGTLLAASASWFGYRYLDERDVRAKALPLIRENMSEDHINILLNPIRMTSAKDRSDVVKRTLDLISEDEDLMNKKSMLCAMRQIRAEDRDDVIEKALPLIREDMNGTNRAAILHAIRKIPAGDRAGIIQLAAPLFRDNLRGHGKAAILSAIQAIPELQRGARITQVQELLQIDFPDQENYDQDDYIQRAKRLLQGSQHYFSPLKQKQIDSEIAAAAPAA